MKPVEDYLDVLQNIETLVISVWKDYPDMTDYGVMRAYDAAIAHYKARALGRVAKPEPLNGADAEVFAAVRAICELRLDGKLDDVAPPPGDEPPMPPIPIEDLLACLKRLRKSVERWNRTGGSRGYLEFVGQFVG